MSCRRFRGRNAPPDFSFLRPDAPSLHDRKLATWALSVGEAVPPAWPERQPRPHRGELSDLDMGLAGPDPGAWPLLRRLSDWLRRGRDAKAGPVSGAGADAIGAPLQMP